MRYLLFIAIFSIVIVSCKSKKEAVAEEKKMEVKEEMKKETALEEEMKNEQAPKEGEEMFKIIQKEIPSNVVARIQRTACFGRCPIFTMNVYESGEVEYYGRKWVDKVGKYSASVDEVKMAALMQKAKEINFIQLENIYDKQGITDLPSVITTIRFGDIQKTVVNRYGGPQELTTFENYFDQLFKDLEWHKVPEE